MNRFFFFFLLLVCLFLVFSFIYFCRPLLLFDNLFLLHFTLLYLPVMASVLDEKRNENEKKNASTKKLSIIGMCE